MRPPNDLKMTETPRHHHDASDSRRGNGGMNRGRGRGHAVSETRRCVEARRCQPPLTPSDSCLLTTTGRCVRRGPSLSYSLLSELGEGDSQQGGGGVRRPGGGQPVTAVAARKARRKQERVDKARRVRAWERVAGSSGHKQQSRGRQDEPPQVASVPPSHVLGLLVVSETYFLCPSAESGARGESHPCRSSAAGGGAPGGTG